MENTDLSTKISQYKDYLEKYLRRNVDEVAQSKLLLVLKKLEKLPVTLLHLQCTGIGKTVNSYRKYDGELGDEARELVGKWKELVPVERVSPTPTIQSETISETRYDSAKVTPRLEPVARVPYMGKRQDESRSGAGPPRDVDAAVKDASEVDPDRGHPGTEKSRSQMASEDKTEAKSSSVAKEPLADALPSPMHGLDGDARHGRSRSPSSGRSGRDADRTKCKTKDAEDLKGRHGDKSDTHKDARSKSKSSSLDNDQDAQSKTKSSSLDNDQDARSKTKSSSLDNDQDARSKTESSSLDKDGKNNRKVDEESSKRKQHKDKRHSREREGSSRDHQPKDKHRDQQETSKHTQGDHRRHNEACDKKDNSHHKDTRQSGGKHRKHHDRRPETEIRKGGEPDTGDRPRKTDRKGDGHQEVKVESEVGSDTTSDNKKAVSSADGCSSVSVDVMSSACSISASHARGLSINDCDKRKRGSGDEGPGERKKKRVDDTRKDLKKDRSSREKERGSKERQVKREPDKESPHEGKDKCGRKEDKKKVSKALEKLKDIITEQNIGDDSAKKRSSDDRKDVKDDVVRSGHTAHKSGSVDRTREKSTERGSRSREGSKEKSQERTKADGKLRKEKQDGGESGKMDKAKRDNDRDAKAAGGRVEDNKKLNRHTVSSSAGNSHAMSPSPERDPHYGIPTIAIKLEGGGHENLSRRLDVERVKKERLRSSSPVVSNVKAEQMDDAGRSAEVDDGLFDGEFLDFPPTLDAKPEVKSSAKSKAVSFEVDDPSVEAKEGTTRNTEENGGFSFEDMMNYESALKKKASKKKSHADQKEKKAPTSSSGHSEGTAKSEKESERGAESSHHQQRTSKHKHKSKKDSHGDRPGHDDRHHGNRHHDDKHRTKAGHTKGPEKEAKKEVKTSHSSKDKSSSSVSSERKRKADEMLDVPTPPTKQVELSQDDILSTLPETTPNYRPLGYPLLTEDSPSKRKGGSHPDAADSLVGIKSHFQTMVYSGKKNATFLTAVPTLFGSCIKVLQDNIDALDYVGGVPYHVLKAVLERCTPSQLYTLEDANPQFVGDTEELWERHSKRDFRVHVPSEFEGWREMYLRKHDEREERLKNVTANISKSMAKAVPVRKTQLAYVDAPAKAPRGVRRQQQKFGTAGPKGRVDPLAKLTSHGRAENSPRAPLPRKYGHSLDLGPSRRDEKTVKIVAPMMQKSLQALKCMGRR